MQLSGIHLYICPIQPLHAAPVGLLQPGHVNQLLHGQRSAAVLPQHSTQQQTRTVPRAKSVTLAADVGS